MGGKAKALLNSHPKSLLGSKGARRCRVCGMYIIFYKINSFIYLFLFFFFF